MRNFIVTVAAIMTASVAAAQCPCKAPRQVGPIRQAVRNLFGGRAAQPTATVEYARTEQPVVRQAAPVAAPAATPIVAAGGWQAFLPARCTGPNCPR